MAITGTGTELDPYIVHSYSELKTVISSYVGGTNMYYINLDNDINCNDYGTDFQWSTVAVNANNRQFTLDLCNHTIKNVKIASGNTMFKFPAGFSSLIKNGKILNVFMSGSNGFNDYFGGMYAYTKLQNVSLSVNSTGVNNNTFYCGFDGCAIYIEGGNTAKNTFQIDQNNNMQIKNTDILLNNVKGSFLLNGSKAKSVSNCRICGKFDSSQAALTSNENEFDDCVIDLECSQTKLSTYSGSSNTGVINTDKLPSGFSRYGMTAVTSQEIINGDALRAKGFVVVNVSA